jgi:hypothetical protein
MGNTYSSAKPSLPALNLSKVRAETRALHGKQQHYILDIIESVLYAAGVSHRSAAAMVTLANVCCTACYLLCLRACRSSRHQTTRMTCT